MTNEAEETKTGIGIVTGASRGIGRAIAERLGEDGFHLALVGRSVNDLEETAARVRKAGGKALVVSADVTDKAQVRAMIERVETELGPVDLLVNNAGLLSAIGPAWENDPDAWWADMTVNVYGVYLGCREVIPGMLERGQGRVVNLVGGGVNGPFPFVSAYAASKAAVMRLTENLAVELDRAGTGVRVFGISPGFVRTAMTELFEKTEAGKKWMDFMAQRFRDGDDVPPELAGELIAAIARGDLDDYHGRYLRAPDDHDRIDELRREADRVKELDLRTLRLKM